MKLTNCVYKIISLTISIVLLTCCNQIELTNEGAQELIKRELLLPQSFVLGLSGYEADTSIESQYLLLLEKEGFITKSDELVTDSKFKVTDKGSPYFLGDGGVDSLNHKIYVFKTCDVEFDKIIGIEMNKEQKTALISFSLKAINVLPIQRVFDKNIDNPRNGEFLFKKDDSEWYLIKPNESNSILLYNIMSSSNKID